MKKCDLCDSAAKVYCDSDQGSLCWDCDVKVHGANFLVAKHSRTLLCHVCQSPTPWIGSGVKLCPTVSVCESCVNNSEGNHHEDEEDDDEEGQDGAEEDEENQVVPWSCKPPPPVSSTSSSSREERLSESVNISTSTARREPRFDLSRLLLDLRETYKIASC